MNITEIEKRNQSLLHDLTVKYTLKYELEYILNNFESIHYHKDKSQERIRLLGKEIIEDKTKQSVLFNLNKKQLSKLEDSMLDMVVSDLQYFVKLFQEIQLIKKIRIYEQELEGYEAKAKKPFSPLL